MASPVLPERITTARLELRPFELGDADDVFAYASDEEWSRYLPVPSPYTRHDAVEFIARQVLLDRTSVPSWALSFEGRAIGGVSLRLRPDDGFGMIGWAVARSHWSRGFATEATRAVIDSAFAEIPELNKIEATAYAGNIASQRVMQKLGMSHEGTLRERRLVRGERSDEVCYGITRSEWSLVG